MEEASVGVRESEAGEEEATEDASEEAGEAVAEADVSGRPLEGEATTEVRVKGEVELTLAAALVDTAEDAAAGAELDETTTTTEVVAAATELVTTTVLLTA